MTHRLFVLLVIGCLFLASPALAQTPRGPEILADLARTGNHAPPRVAMSPSGDFVVVWAEGTDLLGGPSRVWARLFRSDGTPKGKPVRVSNSKAGEFFPQVAMGIDGSFIVVWQGGNIDDTSVFGRRFDAKGQPLGGRFRLSVNAEGSQSEPSVGVARDGSFVVAWTSGRWTFPDRSSDIFIRRFDAAGRPLGPDTLASNTTWNEQSTTQVIMKPDGSFLLGWSSFGGEGTFYDVFARRFDKAGTPLAGEIQLNSGETENAAQFGPALALLKDGSFVAVWTDDGADPGATFLDSIGLLGQRFTAEGRPVGPIFHINVTTRGAQSGPVIAPAQDGGFFVAWTSSVSESPHRSEVVARRFVSNATPRGGEIQLSLSPGNHGFPDVALTPNGTGVAAWLQYETNFDRGADILLRRLLPSTP